MEKQVAHEHVGTKTLWAGRAVSAIPVGILLMSGAFKLSAALAGNEEMLRNWGKSGFPASTLLPIAIVEIACALLYAVPATAVLGAVLVTGYLGGAVATHVRVGEPAFVGPVVFGVLAWLGLYLRDPRIRALLPLRRSA